jgi:hypothetical protein
MSAGLWKGRTVRLRGFPWIDGNEKEIGVSSFQARVLCDKHNNTLSSLDIEAIKVFNTLEKSLEQVAKLQSQEPTYSYRKPTTHCVKGMLFERWVAKGLIGLMCAEAKDCRWHETGSKILEPPLHIIQSIFGGDRFEPPLGLYFGTDYSGDLFDGMGIGPLFHPGDNGVVGGYVSIKGFQFLIWLLREPIQDFSIPLAKGIRAPLAKAELKYRLETIRFDVRKVVNQKLKFEWV